VGCLSRGHATLLRDELRNHTPHAIPLILATRCWLLHVCIETLESPFSLQPRVVPYLHLPNTHAAYKPLFFSFVRRMIAMLINCVAEKTTAHGDGDSTVIRVMSVAFRPMARRLCQDRATG
jgi:hypothetical protein